MTGRSGSTESAGDEDDATDGRLPAIDGSHANSYDFTASRVPKPMTGQSREGRYSQGSGLGPFHLGQKSSSLFSCVAGGVHPAAYPTTGGPAMPKPQTRNPTPVRLPPMPTPCMGVVSAKSRNAHTNCTGSLLDSVAGNRTFVAEGKVQRTTVTPTGQYVQQQDLRCIYDNLAVGYFMPPPLFPPQKPASSSTLISRGQPHSARGPAAAQEFPTVPLDLLSSPGNTATPPASCSMLQTPEVATAPYLPPECQKIPMCHSKAPIFPTSASSSETGPPIDGVALDSTALTSLTDAADTFPSCQEEEVLSSLLAATSTDQLFNSALLATTSTASPGGTLQLADLSLTCQSDSPASTELSSVLISSQSTLLTPAFSSASELGATGSFPQTTEKTGELETFPPKQETVWSKHQVLPPLGSSATTPGTELPCSDLQMVPITTNNTNSWSSHPSSPLISLPGMETSPYVSFASPRNSVRSSNSGRGCGRKRAYSNSPLSSEWLDLNAIIRMSPNSLLAYGSRSSSSSMSPMERIGCYGHLSARNSSSSPHSGSTTSHRHSIPYTPQLSIGGTRGSLDSHSLACHDMQLLEGAGFPLDPIGSGLNLADSNLEVLDQDTAMFKTEELDSSCVYVPPQLPPPPSRPPPSYGEHMRRKEMLQKKSSSDSSQPSNYSSFESSESEYMCQWVDCSAAFREQEDLVQHIEKAHIEQRNGEEFVCFWQGCPRKLKSFNARYKLHIHMRVHSGEKPNKCTFEGCTKAFSRLENLKIHLRSHTGERPYACQHPGCTKNFSNSSDRAKHQRTHQDTKPYACQIPGCTKRYTDPSSLRKHVKNHAAKNDPVRKKLRGGVGEVDPKTLSECLTIQAIRPISHSDNSPPEPADSGLGRSPRGSHPGSSTDQYQAGMSCLSNLSSRSGTAQGVSNQSSPSGQHGSPALSEMSEREDTRPGQISGTRRAPLLPPVGQKQQSRPLHIPEAANQSSANHNAATPLYSPCSSNAVATASTGGMAAAALPPVRTSQNLPNANLSAQAFCNLAVRRLFLPSSGESTCVQDDFVCFPSLDDSFLYRDISSDGVTHSRGGS